VKPIGNILQGLQWVPTVVIRESDDFSPRDAQTQIARSRNSRTTPETLDFLSSHAPLDERHDALVFVLVDDDQLIIAERLLIQRSNQTGQFGGAAFGGGNE